MSKKAKCGCKPEPDQTVLEVIEVLEREVSHYSSEHVPERILRIKQFIQKLNNSCCP
jgi:hypothetical protein